jgi:hypothetical protein
MRFSTTQVEIDSAVVEVSVNNRKGHGVTPGYHHRVEIGILQALRITLE